MDIFLFPPFAFIIALLSALGLSGLASGWAPAPGSGTVPGKDTPRAVDEDTTDRNIISAYQDFFPLAVFFTLLHVAGLMLATCSFNPFSAGVGLAAGYAAAVAVILAVLLAG